MKNFYVTLFFILAVVAIHGPAKAESSPGPLTDRFVITSKIQGCEIDMKQHCQDVTPGQNRGILCLAAHEDQLQPECRAGLIESAMAIRLGTAALDYAYEACGKDRTSVCGNVQPGGGRLINCMKSNEAKINPSCVTALKETGFWDAVAEPSAGQ